MTNKTDKPASATSSAGTVNVVHRLIGSASTYPANVHRLTSDLITTSFVSWFRNFNRDDKRSMQTTPQASNLPAPQRRSLLFWLGQGLIASGLASSASLAFFVLSFLLGWVEAVHQIGQTYSLYTGTFVIGGILVGMSGGILAWVLVNFNKFAGRSFTIAAGILGILGGMLLFSTMGVRLWSIDLFSMIAYAIAICASWAWHYDAIKTRRPTVSWRWTVAWVLILILYFRMTATSYALFAFEGKADPILYVDGIASFIMGVSGTVVVALMNRSPSASTRQTGIIWNVASICVYTLVNSATLLSGAQFIDFYGASAELPPLSVAITFVGVVVLLNVCSFSLLMRNNL